MGWAALTDRIYVSGKTGFLDKEEFLSFLTSAEAGDVLAMMALFIYEKFFYEGVIRAAWVPNCQKPWNRRSHVEHHAHERETRPATIVWLQSVSTSGYPVTEHAYLRFDFSVELDSEPEFHYLKEWNTSLGACIRVQF